MANKAMGRDASDNLSFASSTGDATGKDKRSIERAAAHEEALGAIAGTSLDQGVAPDARARMASQAGPGKAQAEYHPMRRRLVLQFVSDLAWANPGKVRVGLKVTTRRAYPGLDARLRIAAYALAFFFANVERSEFRQFDVVANNQRVDNLREKNVDQRCGFNMRDAPVRECGSNCPGKICACQSCCRTGRWQPGFCARPCRGRPGPGIVERHCSFAPRLKG